MYICLNSSKYQVIKNSLSRLLPNHVSLDTISNKHFLINMVWSLSDIQCQNPPGILSNGQQSPPVGPYRCNDVITFTCNPGYTLVGANRLTCLNTRIWSGNLPRCEFESCSYSLNLSGQYQYP